MLRRSSAGLFALTLVCAISADGDEKLAGIACRSVHLNYPSRGATAFLNEVAVDQSAPGTYFCAVGWNKGYFGIQEQGRGRKVVIFSVWDSDQDDRNALDPSRRVKLLHKHEKVRIGRFGGEGSGGQSFLDLDWKPNAPYRFLVTARPDGDRTEYAGFLQEPGATEWLHLVTFSTITQNEPKPGQRASTRSDADRLSGFYSFIEDFQRDKVSATKARSAHFGPPWVRRPDGTWAAIGRARFTADRNPALTVNARVDADRFTLATGGDTANTDTKLNGTLELPEDRPRIAPSGLPEQP